MRHADDVLYVRRPVETGTTIDVSRMRDDFFTSVRRTLKPAHTLTAVSPTDEPPAGVDVFKYNVRSLPLGRFRTSHELPVLTQE